MPDTLDLARLEKLLRDEAENWVCGPVVIEAADALRDAASRISELESALRRIANGEAFRCQRFAEDGDAEYFLRAQREVAAQARNVLGEKA